jgi:hypothetical protein
MKSKYCLVFSFALLYSILLFAQQPEKIEKKSETILLTLAHDNIFPEKDFNELKSLFSEEINNKTLETKYHSGFGSFDSLRTHLLEFEIEKTNVSADSALTLFVNWYLHFQRTFYSYNKQNFFNSSGTKILFISTSVSCHCTLEMCKKQLNEILKLKSESNDDYSFLIVDSYWNNDLQLKYETYFAPCVMLFNGGNELISMIEYDEKMIEKLNDLLTKL